MNLENYDEYSRQRRDILLILYFKVLVGLL